MHTQNIFYFVQSVLLEMSGNRFQDRGHGGHIWNRAAPIFEKNLPLPMTNAHTRYFLVCAIGSPRNVQKPISRSRSSGSHIWNRVAPIFERNLSLPITNAHTKYFWVRAIGSLFLKQTWFETNMNPSSGIYRPGNYDYLKKWTFMNYAKALNFPWFYGTKLRWWLWHYAADFCVA